MIHIVLILFLITSFAAAAEENCESDFSELESIIAGYSDSGSVDIEGTIMAARALKSEGLCEDACDLLKEALSEECIDEEELEVKKSRWYSIEATAGFNWFKYEESDSAAYYYEDTVTSDSANKYAGDPSHELFGVASLVLTPNVKWIKRLETNIRIGNLSFQQYSRFAFSFLNEHAGLDLYGKGILYNDKVSGDSSDLVNVSGDAFFKYPFTFSGFDLVPKASTNYELESYRYDRNGYASSRKIILKPSISVSKGGAWLNYSLERDVKNHSKEMDTLNTLTWRHIFSADYYYNKFSAGIYGTQEKKEKQSLIPKEDDYTTGELYCIIPIATKFILDFRLNYEGEKSEMGDSLVLRNDTLYLSGHDSLLINTNAAWYPYFLDGNKVSITLSGKWEFINQFFTGINFTTGRGYFTEVTKINKQTLNATIEPLEDPFNLYRVCTFIEASKNELSIDVDLYGEYRRPDKDNPREAKSNAVRSSLSLSWLFFEKYSLLFSGDYEKRWYDKLKAKDQYSVGQEAHTVTNAYVSFELRGKF